MVYYTASIVSDSRAQGILLLSIPIQDVVDRTSVVINQTNFIFLSINLLVLILSVLFSDILTKPIVRLTKVIEQMSRGKLKQRVAFKGRGEIAKLGRAFNDMSERIDNLDKLRNEFVSNASHELRTPLSSMKLLIEALLHEENPDPAMVKEFLGDVNGEIDRLNAIIADLLTIVRMDDMQSPTLKPVDLGGVVSRTVKALGPLAEQNEITLSLVEAEGLYVKGDELKLRQMVSNLVDNAIKYTDPGGSVSVSTDQTADSVLFIVSDTGMGIPEKDLPHVFERFYRVDKARSRVTGGTGLGLSIIKQIVQYHDGEITVESEEGVGSTFTVTLPRLQDGKEELE